MDSKFFRKTTEPNYYGKSVMETPRQQPANRSSLPTADSRFPGYAAAYMEDGRVVTDYRPRCNQNVPAGSQYATKEWMVHNADSIIDVSRRRQATYTGAIYGTDSTVVPPVEAGVQCSPVGCEYIEGQGREGGIGIERVDIAPDLFGTFTYNSFSRPPKAKTGLTTQFEGGRNSMRGQAFRPLGNGPVPSPV
jgi:hypothetical protein